MDRNFYRMRMERWIPVGLFVVALALRVAAALFGGMATAEAPWASSLLWLRMVEAFSGACAVPLTYYLGRRLHSNAAGIWAGALLAVLYAVWFEEAQAQPVGLLSLGVTFTAWFALRASDSPAPLPLWILCGVACLGMPFLGTSGTVADAGLLIVAAVSPAARRPLGILAGAGFIAGVVQHPALTLLPPLWLPSRLLGAGLPFVLAPWRHAHLPLRFWLLGCDIVGWVLLAFAAGLAWWRARLEGAAATAWLLLPVLLGGRMIPFAGLWCVLLAMACLRARIPAALGVLMAFNVAVAVAYPTDAFFWPGQWAQVAGFIQAVQEKGDAVVVYPESLSAPLQVHHVDLTPVEKPARVFLVIDEDAPGAAEARRQLGGKVLQVHTAEAYHQRVTVYLLSAR